ncbi:MAG: hypothetical protein ACLQMG_06220 [Terracidiphilus sp.]
MATANNIPQELDWVNRRANCTVAKVFNELCGAVKNDVLAINAAKGLVGNDGFQVDLLQDGITIVVGQPNRVPRRVAAIGVDQNQIVAQQEWNGGERWVLTVGLNDEGRCTLRLEDSTELEQWQFRKRVLEPLFFGR